MVNAQSTATPGECLFLNKMVTLAAAEQIKKKKCDNGFGKVELIPYLSCKPITIGLFGSRLFDLS